MSDSASGALAADSLRAHKVRSIQYVEDLVTPLRLALGFMAIALTLTLHVLATKVPFSR